MWTLLECLLHYSDIVVGVYSLEGPFWVLWRNWKWGRSWSLSECSQHPCCENFASWYCCGHVQLQCLQWSRKHEQKQLAVNVFGQLVAYIHNISRLYINDLQWKIGCGNCIMNLNDGIWCACLRPTFVPLFVVKEVCSFIMYTIWEISMKY